MKTLELKDEIRKTISSMVAGFMNIPEETIAVSYRVFDSSFG